MSVLNILEGYQDKVNSIEWKPDLNVKYPPIKVNPTQWEIYTQKDIKVPPNNGHRISLDFGFSKSKGLINISISNKWRAQIGIINNTISANDCNDIVIYALNFSSEKITIPQGELIGFFLFFIFLN